MKRFLISAILIGAGAVVVAFWLQTASKEEPPLQLARAVVAADAEFDPCLECHDNLDASLEAGTAQLIGFEHQEHFADSGDVGCGTCHGLDVHDRTPPRTPGMDQCFFCHADDGPAPELPCLRCHDNTTVNPPQSHFTSDWAASHGSGALLSSSLCETCHSKQTFCIACHGVDIPHQDDWQGYPHARATFEAGIESCGRCHPRGPELSTRDDCDVCHHPQNAEAPAWRIAHPDVVRSGEGNTCFECHNPDTCVRCHTTGEEDFSEDFSRLGEPVSGGDNDE